MARYFRYTERCLVDDDQLLGQAAAAVAPLDHQLQLVLGVEALHGARRIAGVVPQPVLVAVGVVDDRPAAEARRQAVGVEARLLLADAGVAPRALGLDDGQRPAVVAPPHVVDEAAPVAVGHAGDLELTILRPVERPARLAQQQGR
jgi:hypothetical protein